MDASHDEPMVDVIKEEQDAHLPLSEDEQRALDLYDQLQQLRLEIAIINAQQTHANADDEVGDMTLEETATARNDILDVRAKYFLKKQVIDSVLSANPILKAVHNGTEASPVERDLLPYIQKRDEAAISVTKMASTTGDLRTKATEAQTEAHKASRRNVELAAEVMELVGQIKDKKSGYMQDEQAVEGIRQLERELKTSRQKWKMVKGTTASIVAGSGLDWARDDVLRDLVLDPEEDD